MEPTETPIADPEHLRAVLGAVSPRAAVKDRPRLHPRDRDWLAASPFLLLATSAADGTCDVSPKGDPPGFVHVLDDHTIAIPDRPGNGRGDGFHNILRNPHVGIISLIPGRPDTLRINGRATLLADAPWFDAMVVRGHRPTIAIRVDIEQIFFHCPKALMRGALWDPGSWRPHALPTHAQIAVQTTPGTQTLEELERYYGPTYEEGLYRPRQAPPSP